MPAIGTNCRVTVFGGVEAFGRGRVEAHQATQGSASFARYLQAIEGRDVATGRETYLVLDGAPCHTSPINRAAFAERADRLHVIWLARYGPQLTSKEREWCYLKRDAHGHLAPNPRVRRRHP